MQSTNIPSKIPLPFGYAAGSSYINPIPAASQIGINDGRASLHDGFPPDTFTPVAAGGIPPFGGDFNGILNEITSITQWQEAGGFFVYDATFSTAVGGYPKGAILQSTSFDGLWTSSVENNTSNPDANGAGWTPTAFNNLKSIALSGSSITLTQVQAAYPILIFTGTLTANCTVNIPAQVGKWIVVNRTTGSFTVQFKTPSGTGVYAPQGYAVYTYGDATNVYYVSSGFSTQEGYLTATQGQTLFPLTGFNYVPSTNNIAIFVNGSKQLSGVNFSETSSTAITFVSGLNAGDIVEFVIGASFGSPSIWASNVYYNEQGTGAVTRTLESKLQETISVLDFGADPTGTSDSTTAITNALNYSISLGKSLYFPAGVYNHTTITITTNNRPSFIMYGDSGGDWTLATTGSILNNTGSGYSFVFNTTSGAYDPLPCYIETLTFKGNSTSAGGLDIIAHGQMHIEKCVFTGFTNGNCINFNAGTNFEGVNRIFDCNFGISNVGIYWSSESYNNVFSIENCTFIQMYSGLQFGNSIQYCQSRNTNIWKNHFENCSSYAISSYGSSWNISIIGNYFENNAANCPPMIAFFDAPHVTFTEPHRCVHISDNFLQGIPFDTGGLIYFKTGVGIKIENTMLAFGTTDPKYFAYLETGISNAYIEFPNLPNGITVANSYSARLSKYYNRTFNSNEDVAVPTTPFPMQVKGTGDDIGADVCTVNSATYTQFNGVVTVNFDITLNTKSGTANGFAQIVGLPVANGGNVAPVIMYDVTGVTTVNPITGYVANNATTITLIGNNGSQFDFNTYVANGARFKGVVSYLTA